MLFETLGDRKNPAVLFFHAMGELRHLRLCVLIAELIGICQHGKRRLFFDLVVRQIASFK